jgi:hypothetical protein
MDLPQVGMNKRGVALHSAAAQSKPHPSVSPEIVLQMQMWTGKFGHAKSEDLKESELQLHTRLRIV